jgi:hypothetical protein
MVKDKQVARQIRDVFLDIGCLLSRVRRIIRDSELHSDERTAAINKLDLFFEDPLAEVFAEIYQQHPDLTLADQSHPPGFFSK